MQTPSPVDHPSHYVGKVPGIECIQVTQHFNFNRGNAIKYVWRAGSKGGPEQEAEDLRKAIKYLEFELERLGHAVQPGVLAMPPSRWHADPARDATWTQAPDVLPELPSPDPMHVQRREGYAAPSTGGMLACQGQRYRG